MGMPKKNKLVTILGLLLLAVTVLMPQVYNRTLLSNIPSLGVEEKSLPPLNNNNNLTLPSCEWRPAVWNCPAFPPYRAACSLEAEEKRLYAPKQAGLSIQQLEDAVGHKAHDLLPKLKALFYRRRMILVGDSMMRQWYETLSCRLGLQPQWFLVNEEIAAKKASDVFQASNAAISPLAVAPLGYPMRNTSGYSVASTANGNTQSESVDYCGFSTKIEYIKYNKFAGGDNVPAFFKAVLEGQHEDGDNLDRDPLLIFNIGIHYGARAGHDAYANDLKTMLQACGALNTKDTTHCLFRDSFPQHQLPLGPLKGFPVNWIYNKTEVKDQCGIHDPNVNTVIFANHSEYYDMAKAHSVPTIKIIDNPLWLHAWNYHTNECTHFCQDPLLWDVLHWTLVEVMEQEAPFSFHAIF